MLPRTTRRVVLSMLCAWALPGCRFTLLSSSLWEPGNLPAAADRLESAAMRPAPKTIPIEMVFVRAEEHDAQLSEDQWQIVDEQALGDGVRRRLAANGLRAGVVTGPLPPALAARFEPQAAAADEGNLPTAPSARPAVVRRLLRLLEDEKRGEVNPRDLSGLLNYLEQPKIRKARRSSLYV